MRKSHKIITAVAVAGIVFAGGSAFTGAGLTNEAGTTQFIGGEVTQTVKGATLAGVEYNFGSDKTKTTVTGVTLRFSEDLDGHPVTAVANNVTGTPGAFDCETIQGTESTCTISTYAGLTGLTITVDSIKDENEDDA